MKISRLAIAAFGFALIVIVLDQLTKAWLLSALDVAHMDQIPSGYLIHTVIEPIFRISFVRNDGVSFGLFGGGSARWGLTIFSLIVSTVLGWWALKADRRLLITAIGLVMGGALGNVIDRIRFGYVVDFLDFSGTYYPSFVRAAADNLPGLFAFLRGPVFPWVFNIADAAISIGVVLLVLDSFLSERREAVGAAPEKS